VRNFKDLRNLRAKKLAGINPELLNYTKFIILSTYSGNSNLLKINLNSLKIAN
jgi:hypothetical protein